MTLYMDIRSKLVTANLVGARVFRPQQTEKPTYPYAELAPQQVRPEIPGHEVRSFDLDIYTRRNDDPDLPRQAANLFRGTKIGGAFLRVEDVTTDIRDNVTTTTITLTAAVPVTQG